MEEINEKSPKDADSLTLIHKCRRCNNEFFTMEGLIHHQVINMCKAFPCKQCGKIFHQKADMFAHQSLHSAKRSYKCQECPERFVLKSQLIRHEWVHICESYNRSSMQRNVSFEHGPRPYKCENCEISFVRKASIDKHMLGHSMNVADVRNISSQDVMKIEEYNNETDDKFQEKTTEKEVIQTIIRPETMQIIIKAESIEFFYHPGGILTMS